MQRPQPRARTAGGADRHDTPAAPPMPAHIAQSPPSVQVAWAITQGGPAPAPVEIDPTRYERHQATREEARELPFVQQPIRLMGGPPAGFAGQSLFDSALPHSVLVTSALTAVRCTRLEAELQAEAPALFAEKQRAIAAAEAAAAEQYERTNAWLMKAYEDAANDPRGRPAGLPPPQRFDPDRSSERKVQQRIDALAAQIHAVRSRATAAADASSAELLRLAEAGADLLWRGPRPGAIPERPDVTHFYEAYDVVAEICGVEKADEMWATMEQRWTDNGKWKTR